LKTIPELLASLATDPGNRAARSALAELLEGAGRREDAKPHRTLLQYLDDGGEPAAAKLAERLLNELRRRDPYYDLISWVRIVEPGAIVPFNPPRLMMMSERRSPTVRLSTKDGRFVVEFDVFRLSTRRADIRRLAEMIVPRRCWLARLFS
jgi:hypothetical protein